MIKIKLSIVGKLHDDYAKNWVEHYIKLIEPHCQFEMKFLKEEKLIEGKNNAEVLRREGERIIDAVKAGDHLVILDRFGRRLKSKYFAQFIEEHCMQSDITLHFVIGGALGVSEQILKFADMRLSLSDMTFPHQLAVVVFCEQLYRAISIVKRLPYHK